MNTTSTNSSLSNSRAASASSFKFTIAKRRRVSKRLLYTLLQIDVLGHCVEQDAEGSVKMDGLMGAVEYVAGLKYCSSSGKSTDENRGMPSGVEAVLQVQSRACLTRSPSQPSQI